MKHPMKKSHMEGLLALALFGELIDEMEALMQE